MNVGQQTLTRSIPLDKESVGTLSDTELALMLRTIAAFSDNESGHMLREAAQRLVKYSSGGNTNG